MNPYALADARQAIARRRLTPWSARLAPLLPLLGALATLPLLRANLYHFLDQPNIFAVGLRELLLRLGLGLAAALCLSTFSTLVRGPDRGIIDLHPLRSGDWLRARLRQLAADRLSWLLVGWILLLPLWEKPAVLLAAAVLLAGAWLAGLGLGVGINLWAPAMAQNPAWEGVLDAIRGYNPRMQAALIWAPGVALALAGVSVATAAIGLQAWLEGTSAGLLGLLAPMMGGVAGIGLAWSGRRNFPRIPAVLGEVDAAWAQVEDPAEERRVYLDWMLRMVPGALVLPLQKDLRQGWRSFRPWISGSWGLAFLAGLSGWSANPEAPLRVTQIALAGTVVVASLGCWMEDPPWLRQWLPVPLQRRLLARGLALWAWSQPMLLAGYATLVVRQGTWGLLATLEGRALLVAAVGTLCGNRWGTRGLWLYVPVGLMLVLG